MTRFPIPPRHAPEVLFAFIRFHHVFSSAWTKRLIPHRLPQFVPFVAEMGQRRWPVPALATRHELANWLGVDDGELAWFADQRGMLKGAPGGALHHYRYSWLERGERVGRLLEAPKPRLKALQRKILDELLIHVPVHEAAHGFVSGRSVLTHAALHSGQPMVMRFDLRAFFTSVTARRAHATFVALGYPIAVVRSLVGVCTTRTPFQVLRQAPFPTPFDSSVSRARFAQQQSLGERHLPQGAPTSPCLANLAAYVLDVRLASLAEKLNLRYSRYADDLVFSGTMRCGALHEQVRLITREEGFELNDEKTRAMPSSARQSVTGVVVNERPNFARHDFDLLKAQLHRLRTSGPADNAQRAELQGRIGWVRQLNSPRAEKLQKTFDQIVWNAPG
ncbi:MAG: reverse transcriptase family protein [Archangium sp.]